MNLCTLRIDYIKIIRQFPSLKDNYSHEHLQIITNIHQLHEARYGRQRQWMIPKALWYLTQLRSEEVFSKEIHFPLFYRVFLVLLSSYFVKYYDEQEGTIRTAKAFSNIGMESELDKCVKVTFNRGKMI